MQVRSFLNVALVFAAALFAGCDNSNAPSSAQRPAGAAAPGSADSSPATAPSGGGAGAATNPAAPGRPLTLAVIPKGTTHSFWKSVEAGAQQAAKDLGVTIQWKGPLVENDRSGQIAVVEQFTGQGVDGIVVAPLDDTALRRPIQAANEAKIPVVIIDSALKGSPGKDFVSFVATNNRQGGVIAGEQLAKLLGGKGKVVLLRYQEGSASTDERESGFLEVMGKNAEIELLVKNRYAGATTGEAKTAALQLADQLQAADGVFCPNESSTFGMLLALRQIGVAGKVKFVGFDGSADLLKGLSAGEIDALVVQNPTKMGYLGVETLVKSIRGETVEQRIDSGCGLVTKENIETPEIRALLGK
ncbi:MAG: substrate-binding domain-containing protein [Planctomycetota bacterium]|nr:substrate-binding domain-containing protein [Planctomycetota bacterium]